MTTFIETFKSKARNKQLTSIDFLVLAAYKAATAKGENKEEIFKGLLRKYFTAGSINQHRPHPYHAVHIAQMTARYRVMGGRTWSSDKNAFIPTKGNLLGEPAENLVTPEQLELIQQLVKIDLKDL